MPLPALAWGWLSDAGVWYPVNLLAGMVLPAVGDMDPKDLGQLHPSLLATAVCIHAVLSLIVGLIYGVLMPTLPDIPSPLAWGGLLMPLLWTGITYGWMGLVNPLLHRHVAWPWFIASQFVFGVVAAGVVMRARGLSPVVAGLLGGAGGGVLMTAPALLWSLASGHGLWYPVNLLAGMVVPHMPVEELNALHADWLAEAVVIHAALSAAFGLAYGLLLPRLRPIPGPMAWGGLLLPLVWTAVSYGLMGVVNPALQQGVDWPWFIVAQFVFGLVAATVVVRSEKVHIPPAGQGPDRVSEYVTG
jgi:hypothetical protein